MLPFDGAPPALSELRAFTTLQQLVRWAFAQKTNVSDVGERWLVAEWDHDVVAVLVLHDDDVT